MRKEEVVTFFILSGAHTSFSKSNKIPREGNENFKVRSMARSPMPGPQGDGGGEGHEREKQRAQMAAH